MCNLTGWRNMWMRWCFNKMCQVIAFQCRCDPGILSKWVISCFYRVEEHQNVILQGAGTSKCVILQGGGTCG